MRITGNTARLATVSLAVMVMAALAQLTVVPAILAAGDKNRTLSFYNIHNKETLTVTYKVDGKRRPDAMKKIDWILRDWRTNEATTMDPELIDLLWEIHTELGSREPIHIISGYRSPKTNGMLRRTVGGQAKNSRHVLGKAIDVHFPDVPVRQLRYSALIRERGGVGYYPTSAIPFVHVDTGRVRHWPRLPRHELALLFPDGSSRHRPKDGRPITKADVRIAQSRHKDLAQTVTAFFDVRQTGRRRVPATVVAAAGLSPPTTGWQTQVASLGPVPMPVAASPPQPPPRLLRAPALTERAERPAATTETARFVPPAQEERNLLSRLFALASLPFGQGADAPASRTPQAPTVTTTGEPTALASLPVPSQPTTPARPPRAATGTADSSAATGWSTGWSPAPAFDEDHPEELSYRPFPIMPMLTLTASPDDPALARLTHPDPAGALALLAEPDHVPALNLRPGRQVARILWAQQFTGEAVNMDALLGSSQGPGSSAPTPGRKVRTALQ